MSLINVQAAKAGLVFVHWETPGVEIYGSTSKAENIIRANYDLNRLLPCKNQHQDL